MGMIINHNMMAMNTHRQLGINSANGQRSIEKLSSGLRINRAGDDAAGLAISEKMRAQIRGLDQASRNSQDAISMIQTGEGALQETQSILQRMEELATQAASDTNVKVDRGEIQKEINQLTSEINRIGNTTEFNTQKVLLGSDEGLVIKDALKLDATTKITGVELAGGATTAAAAAELTVTALAITNSDLDTDTVKFNLHGKEVTVTCNFVSGGTIGLTTASVTDNAASIIIATGGADAVATALKSALEAVIAENTAIAADDYTISTSTEKLIITSKATGASEFISAEASEADTLGTQTAFKTGTDVHYTAATATIDLNGVNTNASAAALVGKGFTLGDNTIEFYDASKGVYDGKADFAVDISKAASAAASVDEVLVAGIVSQIGSDIDNITLSVDGTDAGKLVVTSTADGEAGNGIAIADGVDKAAVKAEAFNATFQVGANQGQGFTIEINDMRSNALGVAGTKDSAATVEGAVFTAANAVTDGTDNTEVEAALDIGSYDKATAAIKVINNAIQSVSAERSRLGAYQNRLEHTINNLNASSENLQASESRIRDVDMAKEMMTFTKNNILQQAAQAMLAQANQAPQGVLQLLR